MADVRACAADELYVAHYWKPVEWAQGVCDELMRFLFRIVGHKKS